MYAHVTQQTHLPLNLRMQTEAPSLALRMPTKAPSLALRMH
jgi:hypothetical protein